MTSFVELPLKVSKKVRVVHVLTFASTSKSNNQIKKHAVRLLRWVGGCNSFQPAVCDDMHAWSEEYDESFVPTGSPMESAEFGLTAITNAGTVSVTTALEGFYLNLLSPLGFFLGRMNCVLGGLGSDYGKAFDHPGTHGVTTSACILLFYFSIFSFLWQRRLCLASARLLPVGASSSPGLSSPQHSTASLLLLHNTVSASVCVCCVPFMHVAPFL